jgi:hypothetical protein
MLNLEATRILPVVEDLTAQHVSADAPYALPTLFSQPLMAN